MLVLTYGRSGHPFVESIRYNGSLTHVPWFGATEATRTVHMESKEWRDLFSLLETAVAADPDVRKVVTYRSLWSALRDARPQALPECLKSPPPCSSGDTRVQELPLVAPPKKVPALMAPRAADANRPPPPVGGRDVVTAHSRFTHSNKRQRTDCHHGGAAPSKRGQLIQPSCGNHSSEEQG